MPAKDRYHDAVIQALQKDKWVIADEQVFIGLSNRRLWVDLLAQKDSEARAVLIEVKGFENVASFVEYFGCVVGQYIIYQTAVERLKLATPLYLAIPVAAHYTLIHDPLASAVIQRLGICLLVFDPQIEEILEWLP